MGQVIGERYEIIAEIGAGGMGTVFRGLDHQSGQPVAIKQLKQELAQPELIERFKREGEALRQLNHPNIVKMLDAIEQDGQHYLVIEYLPAGDLNNLLKQEALSIERTVQIALELADALTRAHHLKIIHRDLKPANVLIAEDGTPRLTDFGIAHMEQQERVTETGGVIGTVDYLAPEAFRDNEEVDSRSDIWAFGVMLFEMLTGMRPFHAEKMSQIIMAILSEPTPDLEALRPDCPVALTDLVNRMLEKDRNARIPSVRLVGAELEAILQGRAPSVSGFRSAIPLETGYFDTPVPITDLLKHNLPLQTTPFVGREQELSELTRLIEHPGTRLLTLLAPGGMGKTRLALETAQGLVNRAGKNGSPEGVAFSNGIYFVGLAALTAPEFIVSTIAEAIGFQFYPGGEPKQQLLDYFREKSLLLVMDNFEHVLEGADLVADILAQASAVKVLVTSRERLNLSGEVLFALSGMDFPDWETPADALDYAAVKLFIQSARRTRPDFELMERDLTYLARICRLVAGMPLGIVLAAAWLEALTLKEISEEIARSFDFLETELRDVPERQRSVRGVFDYSWNRLAEAERSVFNRLSVFQGGFGREAAQHVSGATLKQLTALVNKSLLRRDPEGGRYHVHELLRQYASHKLEASGEPEAIRDAHSTFYLNLLRERQTNLEGGSQREAIQEIEEDIENVRAAWLWAAQQGQYHEMDGALTSLWLYYALRRLDFDGEAMFEQIAALLRNKPSNTQRDYTLGCVMARQAFFSVSLYQREKSDRLLVESLSLIEGGTSLGAQAFGAFVQGYNLLNFGKQINARHYFEKALVLYSETGDRWGTALTLVNLGITYWSRLGPHERDLPQAQKHTQAGYEIQVEIEDVFMSFRTLMSLASIAGMSQNFEEANRLNLQGLSNVRLMGNRPTEGGILYNLAMDAYDQGKRVIGHQYLSDSLAIRKSIGNMVEIATSLLFMAQIEFEAGNFIESRKQGEEALSLVMSSEHNSMIGWAFMSLGFATGASRDYDQAGEYFQGAYKAYEADKNRLLMFEQLNNLGLLGLSQSNLVEARANLEQAQLLVTELDWMWGEWRVRRGLGRLLYHEGDYTAAKEQLTACLAFFRSEDARRYSDSGWRLDEAIFDTLIPLADLDRVEGNYATSHERLREALRLANGIPIVFKPFSVLAATAELLAAQADVERAAELAGLVQGHPKAYAEDRDRSTRLLMALKDRLPLAEWTTAIERGQRHEPDAVTRELLSEER